MWPVWPLWGWKIPSPWWIWGALEQWHVHAGWWAASGIVAQNLGLATTGQNWPEVDHWRCVAETDSSQIQTLVFNKPWDFWVRTVGSPPMGPIKFQALSNAAATGCILKHLCGEICPGGRGSGASGDQAGTSRSRGSWPLTLARPGTLFAILLMLGQWPTSLFRC